MRQEGFGLEPDSTSGRASRLLNRPVRRFVADQSGGVAIHMAILVLPVLLMAGGAIDVANMLQVRTELQNASDASSVAAIAIESPGAIAARSMTSDGVIPAGRRDAVNVFNANISKMESDVQVTFTPTITKTGLTIASSTNYTAVLPTAFLQIIGIPSWTIAGTSQATANLVPYMDFYLLLDNTPSMAIAATQTDINNMVAITQPEPYYSSALNAYINDNNTQCAFACHDMSASPNDFYTLAKINNIKKRIDVVAEATQDLMTTAQSDETISGQFRMAIYTFGTAAETMGLTNVAPLSSNLGTVSQQAANVDVMSVPSLRYNDDMDTDFDGILSSINAIIPNPGDGSSVSSPQKILFFVTDGVADAYYPSTCSESNLSQGRCVEPITLAGCQAIKARGIKIALLYTTYYPLPMNDFYNQNVSPWASQIPTNMQSCASPGLYFEVGPNQGISQAMSALFAQTLQTVRLMQ